MGIGGVINPPLNVTPLMGVAPAGQSFGSTDTRGSGGGRATERSVAGLSNTSRGLPNLEPPEQKLATAGETHPYGCASPQPDRSMNPPLYAEEDPRQNFRFIDNSGVSGRVQQAQSGPTDRTGATGPDTGPDRYRTPDTDQVLPDTGILTMSLFLTKSVYTDDISSRLIQRSLIGPDDPAYFTGYRTPDIRGALFTQNLPAGFEHTGDVPNPATSGYTDIHGLVTYPLSSTGVTNVSSVKPNAKRNYDSFDPSQQVYLKRQKRHASETPAPETLEKPYSAFPYEYRDAPSGAQWPDTVPRVLEADGSISHDRYIVPSRVPGDSGDSSSSESTYQDSGSDSMVHPETLPPSSELEEGGLGTDDESVTFQKAVNEVYRLLPREVCPQGNLPTPRLPKRTGSMDVLDESVPYMG